MQTPSPYLTQEEAAAYCRCCLSSFREHIHPKVKHRRVGRKPLYLPDDLDAHLTETSVTPTSRPSRAHSSAHMARRLNPKISSLAHDLEA